MDSTYEESVHSTCIWLDISPSDRQLITSSNSKLWEQKHRMMNARIGNNIIGHSSLVECWSCGQIQSQMNMFVICVVRLHFAHKIVKHLAMSMDIASYDDMCTHQHSILMILCVPGLTCWLALMTCITQRYFRWFSIVWMGCCASYRTNTYNCNSRLQQPNAWTPWPSLGLLHCKGESAHVARQLLFAGSAYEWLTIHLECLSTVLSERQK